MVEPIHKMDTAAFKKFIIKVGTIISVEEAPGCKIKAYLLRIDFGQIIGSKVSIAQLTNYSKDSLLPKRILAVVNLASRHIGEYTSEVLVLGVPTEDKGTALIVPDMIAVVGSELF
jgi:tRNA-binding protein